MIFVDFPGRQNNFLLWTRKSCLRLEFLVALKTQLCELKYGTVWYGMVL